MRGHKPFLCLCILVVSLIAVGCGSGIPRIDTPEPKGTAKPTEVEVQTDLPAAPTTAPATSAPEPKDTPTRTSSPKPTKPRSTAVPQPTETSAPTVVPAPPGTLPPAEARAIIEDRAGQVIAAIADKRMDRLASFVHPDKGLRFSAYAYVRPDDDLVFDADQMEGLPADETIYTWGTYDGSGMPIELTFSEYYDRFVYDVDFAHAEQVGFNETLGTGNTINNAFEVYPGSIIVEYHFPGFDPQFEGMDWKSLRLVFEENGGVWFLVGVIHDEWTI
jgi:hypothetical protein